MMDERMVGDTLAPQTLGSVGDGAGQHPVDPGETAQEVEVAQLHRVMFDLLRRGGYDRAEVEYVGHQGDYTYEVMNFYQGDKTLTGDGVPDEVREAVGDYVFEHIPNADGISLECFGTARIYTASEYACFAHTDLTYNLFSVGEPGEDVTEEDICSMPYAEAFSGDDFEDEDDEDDEFEDDAVRRLERFFRLAGLRCADCGEFHGDPEEFGIIDVADWRDRMGAEVEWILNNRQEVMDALPGMDPEWAVCCESVRYLLLQAAVLEAAAGR